MKAIVGALALTLLGACQQQNPQNQDRGSNAGDSTPLANAAEASPQTDDANATLSDDREPLAEPKGPIDPKSPEAAGQVAQHYGALIEQGRWGDAANSWSDPGAASAFAAQLQSRGLKHLEIGKPGEPQGAAGSVYVSMPVAFYTGDKRAAAEMTLRRVNDVPGSTEAQRRWHIERIDWKP